MKTFGEAASAETLRYLKHALMHEILLLILDEKFMNAYVHGIIVKCGDGILRRLFPWFFCYIADYPEKCVKKRLICVSTHLHKYQNPFGLYPIPCKLPLSTVLYKKKGYRGHGNHNRYTTLC